MILRFWGSVGEFWILSLLEVKFREIRLVVDLFIIRRGDRIYGVEVIIVGLIVRVEIICKVYIRYWVLGRELDFMFG